MRTKATAVRGTRKKNKDPKAGNAGKKGSTDGGAETKKKEGKGKKGGSGKGKGKGSRGRSSSNTRIVFTEEESALLQREDAQGKRVCIWHHQPSGCPNGDKCSRSHAAITDEEKKIIDSAAVRIRARSASAGPKGGGKGSIPCKWMVEYGSCRMGAKCPYKHDGLDK